jgi:hypothetical protein
MLKTKNEQRAWDQLHKANNQQIWTGWDMCKTFCIGVIAGLIVTFIAVSTVI